jgi:Tetratricopeptide repeat/Bacterial SH3 domain
MTAALALLLTLAVVTGQNPGTAAVPEGTDGVQETAPEAPVSGTTVSGTPVSGTAVPGAAAPEADPGELFVNANTSYEEGDAARAVQLYTSLLERGYGSAELHFNLGNAYLRNGELGRAIASYRRSQFLQPRDEDVQANLAFARKSTKDAIAPPAPSAVASTLFFWHYGLGRGQLALVVLLLNALFFGLLAVRLFSRGSEALRWATMVVLLLLLATGVSLGLRYFSPPRVAVVIPQEIDAHNGPDPSSVVRFKLHAGTEVRIEDSRDGWLRIRLPDGQQGWIQRDWADVVEL